MSAPSCITAPVELRAYTRPVQDENYATAPMLAMTPIFQQDNEEELHTSFEEAISDRLVALHGRLSRLSHPALPAHAQDRTTAPLTDPLALADIERAVNEVQGRHNRSWRQSVFYLSLALIFILLGFNLMGLLILATR